MTERLLKIKNTILIIDDNNCNVDTLLAVLGNEYDIRVALDGKTALSLLENNDLPDLILLDIMMPEMDGYEVCRQLKNTKRTRDIPIIFLTALTGDEDQEKGLSLGAVDYIFKPFNPSIIRVRVNTQLKVKQYRDHLEREVVNKTDQLVHAQDAIIASMAIMAEHRDPETGAHIQRTKSYVEILARELSSQMNGTLTEHKIDMLCNAAPLHDIGKVAIPDEILLKPGKLTSDEFSIMQKHTISGAKVIIRTDAIVGSHPLLHMARDIAEFHHEKWDGSGYPHGLSGTEIPLPARIMAIADVYDALITKRPYKPAFSHTETVKILLEGDRITQPGHFDPQLLSCFERVHEQFNLSAVAFAD